MSITTTGGNHSGSMIPQNMDQAIRLAEMMARGKLVPQHFQGQPSDCLMVIEQAMRWNMSPFAVAQCASSIRGRLMFEGKLVAAAIESSGALEGLFDYKFSGEGANRKIVVSATRRGEKTPKEVEVFLKDAKTDNSGWQKQPDQQLVYHGVRVWGRRWTPSVMLGVYSPEEFSAGSGPDDFTGTTIDARAEASIPQTRDSINDAVPLRQSAPDFTPSDLNVPAPSLDFLWAQIKAEGRKPTAGELLKAIREDLDAAQSADAVDGIISRDDVQKAVDGFRGAAKAELTTLLAEAETRTAAGDGGQMEV